jgi:hypothetical protein
MTTSLRAKLDHMDNVKYLLVLAITFLFKSSTFTDSEDIMDSQLLCSYKPVLLDSLL